MADTSALQIITNTFKPLLSILILSQMMLNIGFCWCHAVYIFLLPIVYVLAVPVGFDKTWIVLGLSGLLFSLWGMYSYGIFQLLYVCAYWNRFVHVLVVFSGHVYIVHVFLEFMTKIMLQKMFSSFLFIIESKYLRFKGCYHIKMVMWFWFCWWWIIINL